MIEADRLFVKICGLRTSADVDAAVEAGADAVGFVLSATSPRAVDVDTARALVAHAAGRATTVLVVHDVTAAEAVEAARTVGVDVLQTHGYRADDTAELNQFPRVWRAVSLAKEPRPRVGAHGEELLLLDSPRAGSGERWDLGALADADLDGPWLLAGGLAPDNVAQAVAEARPGGVDVSSGVESAPGVKDHALIATFVANARAR
ncbi:MAG: phosphoribosylanthranilate isomerase [Aeromicrobium sp.]|uniref:phosphoribosylanthranilate isomerase n=1 Tax=Aeromicrobium sp. TaxID=1871063 RepID=UPI0039E48DF1